MMAQWTGVAPLEVGGAIAHFDGSDAMRQAETSTETRSGAVGGSLTAGRRRVVIEGLTPLIDCGRFPIKRAIGERIDVGVDIFADGHDEVAATLQYRKAGERDWRETALVKGVNDRWSAGFVAHEQAMYEYTVVAWIDHFASWRRDLRKRLEAGQDISSDIEIGAQMIESAVKRAAGDDEAALETAARRLRSARSVEDVAGAGLADDLAMLMRRHDARRHASRHDRIGRVVVDRERARFSAWYEFFPRSCGPSGRHGTLADCRSMIDRIAALGFDVAYLPPIHPIGQTHRKGRNNNPTAKRGDVGSPWAIGGVEGGHKTIHPDLGTLDDFRGLLRHAQSKGVEIALDIAFQCSPDHPYVREHPEWFKHRPDGSIQYAENPPKKYEDIYPFDFECDEWRALWEELRSVFTFWIEQGVSIFRVDNPHTKPLPFWEWLISVVHADHPDVIFLAEAFTRPKVMKRLAKAGFTQSYTYFAWRNARWEIEEYFTELNQTEMREYFRPNVWPNTPDILTEQLQFGGRAAFVQRFILGATLGACYGVYGPAFELCEGRAREPGSEEYLDSEKYQIRDWDLESPDSIEGLMGLVNRIRREHPALQSDHTLRFHSADNEQLLVYSKRTRNHEDVILCVVNLDPHHKQTGWVDLDLAELGIDDPHSNYQVHDLVGEAHYVWTGRRNYVELDPDAMPAHIFEVRRRVRSERNFDYFM